MAKFITTLLIFLVACSVTATNILGNTATLTVEFTKIKQLKGDLIIELFAVSTAKTQEWNEVQPVGRYSIAITSSQETFQWRELPLGHYAMRVFQDINNNQELDKLASNIPKEPVGFSQNPSLFRGEPSIEDCQIVLNKDETISIKLRHRKIKNKKRH